MKPYCSVRFWQRRSSLWALQNAGWRTSSTVLALCLLAWGICCASTPVRSTGQIYGLPALHMQVWDIILSIFTLDVYRIDNSWNSLVYDGLVLFQWVWIVDVPVLLSPVWSSVFHHGWGLLNASGASGTRVTCFISWTQENISLFSLWSLSQASTTWQEVHN